MILANATIMGPDFKLIKKDILIEGEKIAKIGDSLSGDKTLDLSGKLILPGFIDSHIHGGLGDFSDENIEAFTNYEAKCGITSVAITTASSEFDTLLGQFERISKASLKNRGAKIAAIHAEGPFLNKKRKGGMNEKNIIAPDAEKLDMMIEKGNGLLKIITIAPETDGAYELISYAKKRGITVSMGHTDATTEEAAEAIKHGATQLTHAFNAMRPYNHREPGILGEALLNPDVVCEMICDYVHLHPQTVMLIYKIKGADKINMISDATKTGVYENDVFYIKEKKHTVKNGVIVTEDGTISGSTMSLAVGVRNLIKSNIPVEDVSKMASLNPAKSLKIDDVTGSIEEGKLADLVVLDEDYNVECTFVNGVQY